MSRFVVLVFLSEGSFACERASRMSNYLNAYISMHNIRRIAINAYGDFHKWRQNNFISGVKIISLSLHMQISEVSVSWDASELVNWCLIAFSGWIL